MTGARRRRAVPRATRQAILEWYEANGRRLAIRSTADPYAVLVSEVMAQQTQIGRVIPAWTAWMVRFPTVESVAAAPVAEVIRQWSGLGYNRRAVSLHRAATAIVERHDGRVPRAIAELERLPGVGPYTARAVAAIAFGEPVGAVDVNVRRVLGRIVAGDDGLAVADLQRVADASVPRGRAASWTHALMDLGATLCRPRAPRCDSYPALDGCRFARGVRPIVIGRRRPAATAFPATSRWLRGRIVEQLRESGGWLAFDEPIGSHSLAAVREAIRALARDGLVEVALEGDMVQAQLPVPGGAGSCQSRTAGMEVRAEGCVDR